MKLSVLRNLQIGFGLSLLLLIGISFTSYFSVQNLLKSARLVDHSNLVVTKLENTMSTMKDAETGQRGFLLTNDVKFLEPYNGSYQKAINLVNEAERLTVDNHQQQQNMAAIRSVLLTRLNILQTLIDKKRDGKEIAIGDLQAGKQAMDALRIAVDKAESDEMQLSRDRNANLKRYLLFTPILLIVSILLAVMIAIYSYRMVANDVGEKRKLLNELVIKEQETAWSNEELAVANEELISANNELADAQQNIQQLNDELAATNEELACSNEELMATNEELYNSHQELEDLNKVLEDRVISRTEDLAESEGRFRTMMETIPQIAWTNTTNGEFTFYNEQWYAYTGLTPDETHGQGWSEVVHPDDLNLTLQKYRSIIISNQGEEFEMRARRFDGVYRWYLIRMQPVKNETGQVQLWVGTATDIHELKQLQQQKDDFISIASHELKTPVTSLKISLQLLNKIDNHPTDTFPKLIGQANKSMNKINKLIDDLLDFSKFNMGQLNLTKTRFAIGKLIDDSCHYIRTDGLHAIVTDGAWDLQVEADAARIEQVVVNLVNNAVKYAPESKQINIDIQKENGMAKISVTDKGPGIPVEKLQHLFERYYQGKNNLAHYSGLGLGLYISSEIIKKHKGQIGVVSEQGKGSTFWFTLPLPLT